jgi:CHASE4 domain
LLATTQNRKRFLILVAMPLVLTALCTSFASVRMLNGISDAVDAQEAQRSWQAVNSAFTSTHEQIAAIVADNARWDDAVEKTDGVVDQEWAKDTWGVGSSDMNYDTAFVISPTGKVLVAFQKGEIKSITPSSYYGGSLGHLMLETPTDGTTFKVVHTLAWATDGLVSVAAAPIVPTTDSILRERRFSNRLILSRSIGEAELAKMERQYIINRLAVHPLNYPHPEAKIIFDSWGSPVAAVSWLAQRPGDAARSTYVLLAVGSVIAMILVLLPISLVHAKTIKRLQLNEQRAQEVAGRDVLSGLPNRRKPSKTTGFSVAHRFGRFQGCQ